MNRPIIMGTHSVRAILSGAKTQTRRVVKDPPTISVRYDGLCEDDPSLHYWEALNERGKPLEDYKSFRCPYGAVGDQLWVKQEYRFLARFDFDKPSEVPRSQAKNTFYEHARIALEGVPPQIKWGSKRSAMFMPRWASFITLELTDVRVEQLQEISEGDAVAEGYLYAGHADDWQRHDSYRVGWDRLNAARGYSWESNPWVWVLEFKQVKL